MPSLSGETWRLLFADSANLSRAELGALIEGMGNIADAASVIAEAIDTEIISVGNTEYSSVGNTEYSGEVS